MVPQLKERWPCSLPAVRCTGLLRRASLDGLPLRREITFAADFVGPASARSDWSRNRDGVAGPPEVSHRSARMTMECALVAAASNAHRRRGALPAAPPAGWSEEQIEAMMVNAAQIDLTARSFSLQVHWCRAGIDPVCSASS